MKKRELRSLWNSNGLWTNSGYAQEMKLLLPRLAKDGWPTAQIAFWGLDGYPVYLKDYPDIKIYSKIGDQWGSDAMVMHAADYKANVVFSMQDIWPLNPQDLQKLRVWIPWVPIDKSPVPENVLDKLRYAYKIVTFSKFGQEELEKKGFASTLILEGTDPDIFKPMDKTEIRKQLGLAQDAFIFGMIAANKENPPRKGFQEALEAFALFYKKHPNAAIVFHVQQPSPAGFPLQGFANYLGIANRTFFIPDYDAVFNSDADKIAKEMNAFDVLLHPSQTEGFGLTVVEANACGIPAIVNNTTSMPEMVIDGITGAICKAGKGRWTNDNSWVYPADVDSLYEQMEKVFDMVTKNPNKVKKDTRDHIMKNYHIDDTAKKWITLLEGLQDDLLTNTSGSSTIHVAK